MTLPEKVSAIVFDVDGTLYDQRRLRVAMLGRLLRDGVKAPISTFRAMRFLQAYRAAHEQLRHETAACDLQLRQFEIACHKIGFPAQQAEKFVKHYFETAPLGFLRRFMRPDLSRFLMDTRKRGIRLGVFSDYPAKAKLEAMSLTNHFDAVVSSNDVGWLKPHPAGLECCLSRLGSEPQNSLYVGDRPDVDTECARRAGVCAVIIGARAPSVSHVDVSGFEELRRRLC